MKNIDLFQNAAWNWFPLQCRFEFVTTYSRSSVACVDSFNFGFSLNNVAIKSGTNLSAFIYTKDLIVRVTYAESGGTLGFIHPNLNNLYLLKLLSREFPRTSSVTCGGGIRRRFRTCTTASCEGITQETGECNVHSCYGRVSVKTQFTISFRTWWCNNYINVFMKKRKIQT